MRREVSIEWFCALAVTALVVLPAAAQPVKDEAWASALKAQQFADVQRAASERIAAKPDDLDAHAALIRASLGSNKAAQRSEALALVEACVARLPNAAVCHYGVGALLGAQALGQSKVKGTKNLIRIREAFTRAVALDPRSYAAHSGLVQFLLFTPSAMGGGSAKAGEAARAAAAALPEHAKLLEALVAIHQKQYAEAEQVLANVASGSDAELADGVTNAWAQIGSAHLAQRQPGKALPVFDRLAKLRPQHALGHYGLARVHSDLGAWDAAVALLELSAKLEGADSLPIDYRLGIAWQAKGERDKAQAALTRYVAAGRGNPRSLEDAKKRLSELQ